MGRLDRIIEELSDLPRKIAVDVAPQITTLLRKQFTSGADPYGRPWAPMKPSTLARGRRPPPLSASKKLRDGTVARPSPGNRAGLRLVVRARYGTFHQTGFRVGRTRVPARRILPQQGMPASWRAVFAASSRRLAQEAGRRA
jgi:hypothetical protein